MKRMDSHIVVIGFVFLIALSSPLAQADGGWYIGGSVGQAGTEIDDFGIDDSDFAWKAYGGYVVDLPLIDLGVEGGYVDFGSPSEQLMDLTNQADVTGFNLWGVAGVDVGPLGLFGKLGAIAWDVDGQIRGIVDQNFNESGTDVGYGVGVKFMLFSAEVRAEYERYEIEDGLDMFSVGLNWVF